MPQDWFASNAPKDQEVTPLSTGEERAFKQWATTNKITDVDHPESRYDYRGYWKDVASKGIDQRKAYDDGLHFPDTYKQHGHPTFSIESKYSKGPNDGGRWEGEKFIPATESDWFAANAADDASQLNEPEAPPMHPHARVAQAAGRSLGDAFRFVKQAVTDPVETAKGVGKGLLNAQFDAWKKADTEMYGGSPVKSALYRTAAMTPVAGPMAASMVERAAAGEGPELVGEMGTDLLMGGAAGLTMTGAKAAFSPAARAARAELIKQVAKRSARPIGASVGAGVGGMVAGPMGAAAGASIGAEAGGMLHGALRKRAASRAAAAAPEAPVVEPAIVAETPRPAPKTTAPAKAAKPVAPAPPPTTAKEAAAQLRDKMNTKELARVRQELGTEDVQIARYEPRHDASGKLLGVSDPVYVVPAEFLEQAQTMGLRARGHTALEKAQRAKK